MNSLLSSSSSSLSLSHVPFCERMANTPTHSKHPGHTTSKRGQTLLHSPSAEKVFLVTTAQHMTRSFQTELSITRSSATCSCLTTVTSVLSVSTAQTALHSYQQSLTPRTELSAPTQRATQHPRCCPRSKFSTSSNCSFTSCKACQLRSAKKKKVRRALLARQLSVTMMWHSELDPSSLPHKSRIVGPMTVDMRGKRHFFTRLATVQFERAPG